MKKILFTLSSILIICFANAQDTIILRNNAHIKAKVMEVGDSEIRFKRFDNTNGPVYVINTSEVQMIKYENGSSDIFSTERDKELQTAASSYHKSSGTIYVALSVPLGSFESSLEGAAQLGWGVGLNGASASRGRSAYFSYQISYANHPYEFNGNANGNSYSLTGDYNVWHLLAGVGTRSQPSSVMFYINIMGGLNYTSLKGVLVHVGYSNALAFALSFGGGLIISHSVNVGLKYMHSSPTFKNSDSSAFDVEQKISIFQLTVGVQF